MWSTKMWTQQFDITWSTRSNVRIRKYPGKEKKSGRNKSIWKRENKRGRKKNNNERNEKIKI